jgi:hypothetical protein
MTAKKNIGAVKSESAVPWCLSFDPKHCIWSIYGETELSIAAIHCGLDGWNEERRVAAHLMVNAERFYTYITSMAKTGDTEASALAKRIQGDLAGEDDTIETVADYLPEAFQNQGSGIKKSEYYARAGGRKKRGDDDKHGPWIMTFDKSSCIWSIRGGPDLPIAVIRCAFDGRNDERRVAGHFMVNAQRMYAYVKSRVEAGDVEARALSDRVEAGLAGKGDAIETIDGHLPAAFRLKP